MRTGGKKGRNESVDTELLTRTSWVDAGVGYRQVKKGKADGNQCALWLRWKLQKYLFKVGCFIQLHCGKFLFLGLLSLSLCCIGLKEAKVETNVEKLWVEEGGRLEEELSYTKNTIGEGTGTTSQLVIQTPKRGTNVLNVESFQYHLQTLKKVTEIEIYLYEVTWKFHDICYLPEFPVFENTLLDQTISDILPCVIITPLDCFWDGAKLLGPDHAVTPLGSLKWTSLDPLGMVNYFKTQNPYVPSVAAMEEMMNKSGISRGYLEKPCLDPYESQCPTSAPNHDSGEQPDIGAELTNGCHGISSKYMHWHEDLIVGGVSKNKTGHIVRAEALQSIIQLMGHQALHKYWSDDYKTHSIDWTLDKAKAVLEAWQRKFTEVVKSAANSSVADDVYGYSSMSLTDIMKEFSSVSVVRITLGYILMLFYACISLLRWNNVVQSQSGIGIAGVLLVALSVAAGLGMCSLMGIVFNASTTQIVPFLALGLGVDDMFLIAHTYYENAQNKHISLSEQTGACLKRTGVTVLLTSVTNMLAFFSASIIPIPALRAFSLQAGILTFFNLVSVLLLFPAICSWDLIRKDNKRIDIFCCFQSYADNKDIVIELQPHSHSEYEPRDYDREGRSPPRYSTYPPSYNSSPSPPPSYNSVIMHNTVTQTDAEGGHVITNLAPTSNVLPANEGVFVARPTPLCSVCPSTSSSQQRLTPDEEVTCKEKFAIFQRRCLTTTLTSLATNLYGPFLKRGFVKAFSVIAFLIMLCICIFGTTKVKDGLELTDVVPKETHEYNFLQAQSQYFGFYNIYLVTKDGFDYPNGQRILTKYHRSFQSVDNIIKREDGSMPNFWLDYFRLWLQDLQKAFDTEYADGRITKDHWNGNASDSGILAYKLLAQTGDVDNPVDKSRITVARLLDSEGIISPDAFYNYLTAWVSNDAMAYAASQAEFHPKPKIWYHDPQDFDFKVPKSQPLVYTQLPFYLTDMSSTEIIIHTIKSIRDVCDRYSDKGLPNYPNGVPFTFWEQYINLRFYLGMAILCVLLVTFVVLTIILMNPWLASIIVVFLTMMLVELFGLMGLGDIKLSAVPAVILVVSIGIGVEFTVHVAVGFLTAIGSRNRRMTMSLQHTFAPVVHGAISTFLGIIMLVGAEFEFIVKYFFNVLAILIVIGLLNGLVLLPVLLSLLGPPGEVRPRDNPDRLATPSPQASPKPKKKPVRATRSSRRLYPRVPSDLSLTTITEEPTQYSSHEIVVEPEVLVETTTVPMDGRGIAVNNSANSSRNSTPPGSVVSTPKSHHVTRVKATATVKVEVHTPIPGSVENVDHDHIYKSKRRKQREKREPELSDSDSSSRS